MTLRKLVESTTLYVLLVLGGCSSDTRDSSPAADTSFDTGSVDSAEGGLADTSRDSAVLDAFDSSDPADSLDFGGEEVGDTGLMLPKHPCRPRAEGLFNEFHVVNSGRAVNTYYFSAGHEDWQEPCGAVTLFDIVGDGRVESLDTRIYPNSYVVTTVVDEKILAVSVEYEIERNTDDDGVTISEQVGSVADVYEIDGDELNRLSRTRFFLDEPSGQSKSYPLTLDSNGDEIILVGRQRFVELELRDDDRLAVRREVARGEELDSVTERAGERYEPDHGRQIITDDGYVVEIEHGVSIWTLPPREPSGEDSSTLVSFVAVPNSLYRRSLRGRQDWAYEPRSEFVYLSEGAPIANEPSEEAEHIEIVDVSQRDSPTVAARWHVTEDFSPPIESNVRPYITVTPDRVYLREFRPSERRAVLRILDISQDATVVDEIGEVRDFPVDDPGKFEDMRPRGSRMFLGFSQREYGFSIHAVVRNSLESMVE